MTEGFARIKEAGEEANGLGRIQGCSREYCPTSCCRSNLYEVSKGHSEAFRVLLWSGAEASYQQEILSPSAEELGVVINRVPFFDGKWKRQQKGGDLFLMSNCKGAGEECKLQGRKPIPCAIKPFGLSRDYPIAVPCPHILRIIHDQVLIDRVMLVRSLLGLRDNDVWMANLLAQRELIAKCMSESAW